MFASSIGRAAHLISSDQTSAYVEAPKPELGAIATAVAHESVDAPPPAKEFTPNGSLLWLPPGNTLASVVRELRAAPLQQRTPLPFATEARYLRESGGLADPIRAKTVRDVATAAASEPIRSKAERELMHEKPAYRPTTVNIEARRPSIAEGLAERARQAGLDAVEAEKLKSILLDTKSLRTDKKLVEDLLATENPARALKTFNQLDIDRRQHPDRIAPDIVRALSMGVGEARTSSSQGNEGILGNIGAVNAANALINMPQKDYDQIRRALNSAGQPPAAGVDAQTERALILKAVAARSEPLTSFAAWGYNAVGQTSPATHEITQFAAAIRGQNAATLIERTSAIDLDGGAAKGDWEALQQKWNDSCVQTTLQMARAEADPIYAWLLHNSDVLHNESTMGSIADEQKQMLTAAGGDPQARKTKGEGTTNGAWTASLNGAVSPTTNQVYENRSAGDSMASRTNAVEIIEMRVKAGNDVPIRVKWNGDGAHALLVSDVRGSGNNREFLVTDPWNGRTDWVSRQDIINGNTNFFAGTGNLTDYWY